MGKENPIGIGVDIANVNRFRNLNNKEKFIEKIFTKREIGFCQSKVNAAERFAARFAGKEAVIKAFTPHNRKLYLKDIEIIKENEFPEVIVNNTKGFSIKLSLSHEHDYAMAFALVTRDL